MAVPEVYAMQGGMTGFLLQVLLYKPMKAWQMSDGLQGPSGKLKAINQPNHIRNI
jgi:hypothetical protein